MCKDNTNNSCRKCICKIPLRRWFLPTVGVCALLIFKEVRNFLYLPLVLIYCTFVLFWNFPDVLYFANSKPLFVEDLFIDPSKLPNYDMSKTIKSRFTSILNWTLITTNSLVVGALADFWLYKTSEMTSWIELLGVTGGILKIFQTVNSVIASILIYIIRRFVIKENKKNKLGIDVKARKKRTTSDDFIKIASKNSVDKTGSINNSNDNISVHINTNPMHKPRNRSPQYNNERI